MAARLRAIRKEQGLTQDQVARRLGLTEGAYRHYESGRSEPTFTDIPQLAAALGVTTEALFATQNQVMNGLIRALATNGKRRESEQVLEQVYAVVAKIEELLLGPAESTPVVAHSSTADDAHNTNHAKSQEREKRASVAQSLGLSAARVPAFA